MAAVCSKPTQWRIQDFPGHQPWGVGGHQPIIWPIFYQKLHENEEIWPRWGGGVPCTIPPNVTFH